MEWGERREREALKGREGGREGGGRKVGEREGGRKRLYTFPSATNKAALPTSVGHPHHSGVKHCNKQEAQTYPQQNVGYRTLLHLTINGNVYF